MFLLLANSGFILGLIYHQGIAHNSCASSAIPQDTFQRIGDSFPEFPRKINAEKRFFNTITENTGTPKRIFSSL
jgi:hypothetical protein